MDISFLSDSNERHYHTVQHPASKTTYVLMTQEEFNRRIAEARGAGKSISNKENDTEPFEFLEI